MSDFKILNLTFTEKQVDELHERKKSWEDFKDTLELYKLDNENHQWLKILMFFANELQDNKDKLRKISIIKFFNMVSYTTTFFIMNAAIYFLFFELLPFKVDYIFIPLTIQTLSLIVSAEYIHDMYKESNTLNEENEKLNTDSIILRIDEEIRKLELEEKYNLLKIIENKTFKSESYNYIKSIYIEKLNKPL